MPSAAVVADVMAQVRNYYECDRVSGDFTVRDGSLGLTLAPGEWVAVAGAGPYSGVMQADDSGCITALPDMTFTGTVWRLEPPESLLRLCDRIVEWTEKNPMSALKSESLGPYSCTVATGASGRPLTWSELFAP